MAFSFDSPLCICALLLCASTALAWRLVEGEAASVRLNLRFAAVLFAADGVAGVAAAGIPQFAEAAFVIVLLTAPLACVALGLSLFPSRPAPPLAASIALVAGLGCGLVAVLMDASLVALVGQALAVSAMILAACTQGRGAPLRALEIAGGALALFFGAMALADGALAGASILLAAGLLGVACASQARVEQQATPLPADAIGRPRL